MLIGNGWGNLVPAVPFIALGIVVAGLEITYGPGAFDQHRSLADPLFYGLTALILLVVGYRVNRPRWLLIDEDTRDALVFKPSHTFFFIPMQYWGYIAAVLGLMLIVF